MYFNSGKVLIAFLLMMLLGSAWQTSLQAQSPLQADANSAEQTNPGSEEILIDKIVAVVEDSIISFSDIEKAVLLYPLLRSHRQSEEAFYRSVLTDLINYRTLYLEFNKDLILNESDYEKIQLQVIEKAGSIQELNGILKRFDMNWDQFRDFIKERVFFDKIIKEKFQFKSSIEFKAVEAFYQHEYVKMQRMLNLVPRSIEEMAPEIENHLRKIETGKKIDSWIRDIKSTYNIKVFL